MKSPVASLNARLVFSAIPRFASSRSNRIRGSRATHYRGLGVFWLLVEPASIKQISQFR